MVKREARRPLAGCRQGIAGMSGNVFDACGASHRCDKRYTTSIRRAHADPPRAFSAFLRHQVLLDAHLSAGDSTRGPASFPSSRRMAGTGGSLPVVDARLRCFCSIFCRVVRIARVVTSSTAGLPRQGPDQCRELCDFQGFPHRRLLFRPRFVD